MSHSRSTVPGHGSLGPATAPGPDRYRWACDLAANALTLGGPRPGLRVCRSQRSHRIGN